jgi:signal transduction histidine kinase
MNTQSKTSPEVYLSSSQAAEYLHVSKDKIDHWIQNNILEFTDKNNAGELRIEKTSLDILLRKFLVVANEETTNVLTKYNDKLSPFSALSNTQYMKHQHLVHFYEDDDQLIDSLLNYMTTGIKQDYACIVVATADHLNKFEKELLRRYDYSVDRLKASGRLTTLDSNKTLQEIMNGGMPDEKLFTSKIESLISKAEQIKIPVIVFGEMVAHLWEQGNVKAMIQLEEYWNDLAHDHVLSLYCAYPIYAFKETKNALPFSQTNSQHSYVIPGESYDQLFSFTERAEAIAVLQQKSEALKSATKENEQLIRLNKAKDDFISIASHQLRTPATGVKQYIGMLLDGFAGDITKEQETFLLEAYKSNERQIKIIDDLLSMAKTDAGSVIVDLQVNDISKLIKSVVNEQMKVLQSRKQIVSLHLPESLMSSFDESHIRMVIENLLSNASKYSDEGTTVTIRAVRHNNTIDITIKDTGVGISEKEFNLLFQKFSRLKNRLSNEVDGNGLGLYWVKKIVEIHNGTVSVKSKVDHGTEVKVTLPINLCDHSTK